MRIIVNTPFSVLNKFYMMYINMMKKTLFILIVKFQQIKIESMYDYFKNSSKVNIIFTIHSMIIFE